MCAIWMHTHRKTPNEIKIDSNDKGNINTFESYICEVPYILKK